ncbi:MAG: hypothetical protein LBP28_05315 [Coriobacteriales bacterium]|jgi:hypothetical protein|nr:hypothetical protein [Coriobacteriales bacterium]
MSEITTKEQAENYVFANNSAQSRLYNSFNLYVLAGLGILIALLGFLVGLATQTMTLEVAAFVQAGFGVGGLIFAIWNSEMREQRVRNTYLTQAGLSLEIAGYVLSLVVIGGHLISPDTPTLVFLIPWLVYALSFLITYQVVRVRAGVHERKVSKTTSFATLLVIIIASMFIAQLVGGGIATATESWSPDARGLLMLGAGVLMAFILGVLTAIAFFKNLLVKRFDIDLSRLYEANN